MKQLAFTILIALTLSSCTTKNDTLPTSPLDTELESLLLNTSSGKGKVSYILPQSNDYANIPQDPKNPLSADKVALGKLLFHETAIGLDSKKYISVQTYSCASCHHAKAGFQSCLPQGIGEGGVGFGVQGEGRSKNSLYQDSEIDVQPVRTPSALNIAYQTNILWNGQFGATHLNQNTQSSWTVGTPKEKNNLGYQGTETQAIAGQDVHRLFVNKALIDAIPLYKELFKKAFPTMDLSDNQQLKLNAGLAIAAYERSLLATEAPFQQWLKGNYDAMTADQKNGAKLFFGKANCTQCHNGPSLANMDFYALGFNDLHNGSYGSNQVVQASADKVEHKGRGGFTGKAADMFKFKVPQLYNLKDSPFYGHGSSFTKIEDVITYKNSAKAQNSNVPSTQLALEFKPLNLTTEEIRLLSEFIRNGLYDKHLSRYAPQQLPSGLAFPNNDVQSRKDLGF